MVLAQDMSLLQGIIISGIRHLGTEHSHQIECCVTRRDIC